MPNRKPTPETKAFGDEVARQREVAHLSRAQLAKLVAVSPSYIGLVETGVTRCRYDFAQRIDQALGTTPQIADSWDEFLRGKNYPLYFADFAKVEAEAVLLRTFQMRVVYGLLQTEAYMRAILRYEEDVETRLKRQAILTCDKPPLLAVLLDESVLYRQVGERTIMYEQLDHLIKLSSRNLIIQIVPMDFFDDVKGSFVIATAPGGEKEIAHLTHLAGGLTATEPVAIVEATTTFTRLQAHALSVDASQDLIRKVMKERYG